MEYEDAPAEVAEFPGVSCHVKYSDIEDLDEARSAMYELQQSNKKPVVVKVQRFSGRSEQVSSCLGCGVGAAAAALLLGSPAARTPPSPT